MEKIKFVNLLLTLVFCFHITNGQTTDAIYKLADDLLAAQKCDSALSIIQHVPAPEKESGRYLELTGRVYECKNNKEYADIYYSRAKQKGVTHPGWVAPAESPADMTNDGKAVLENERRKLNSQTSQFRKGKRTNTDDFYFVFAMDYGSATNWTKAMNRHFISFSMPMCWPAGDKYLIEVAPLLGVIYGRQDTWHNDTTLNATGIAAGDGMGLLMGIIPSVSYKAISNRNNTISCGVSSGAIVWANGAWMTDKHGDINDAPKTFFIVGPRITYYGWSRLYLSAEYMHVGFRKIAATLAEKTKLVPVNLDHLRVTLGIRLYIK
jgi:hypothetical protein